MYKQFVTTVRILFYFLHDVINKWITIWCDKQMNNNKMLIITHWLSVSLALFTFWAPIQYKDVVLPV